MSNGRVVHDTIVVERRFPVARSLVFAAWADVEQRRLWHFPGDDWVVAEMTQEFRVGGVERSRFGPQGAADLFDEGRFLDIVDGERIVSAGTMHKGGVRISVTLCTVELTDDGDGGTHVRLTDQSAFLDGREKPEQRGQGWGKVFERLQRFLQQPARGSAR